MGRNNIFYFGSLMINWLFILDGIDNVYVEKCTEGRITWTDSRIESERYNEVDIKCWKWFAMICNDLIFVKNNTQHYFFVVRLFHFKKIK